MKVYLAAPYGEMARMREWAIVLGAYGHTVTARWIHGNEEDMTPVGAAYMDLTDIDNADAVVSLTLKKGTLFSSGGRHVEFGYGLAKGKTLVLVDGGIENVFHNMPQVMSVTRIEDAAKYLSNLEGR